MITDIIKLLQADNYYGVSKEIEIAKGKYERVTTWEKFVKQAKRMLYEKG